jgi:hypothetical protein
VVRRRSDRIPADYGTGIVMAPGRTTSAGHTQLKTHADAVPAHVAFLDAPDTPTDRNARRHRLRRTGDASTGLFWPWVRVAGLTPGRTASCRRP